VEEIERSTIKSEYKTRVKLIDKQLLACGWQKIENYAPGIAYTTVAVREYPTDNGPADYALFYNGELLAFVEAKKVEKGPLAVIDQAERYARGLKGGHYPYGEYGLPFVYATNGVVIAFRDLRHELNLRREVKMFHTPKALYEKLHTKVEEAYEKLAGQNPHTMLRPYQQEAVSAVLDKIREGKREMLVAMATGTGKTYTIVSLIHRLMASGLARRVLFLVDRRALAAQAVTALNSFEAVPNHKFSEIYQVYSNRFKREDFDEDDAKFDPKVIETKYLTDPGVENTFVYVCTIQRMRRNLFGIEDAASETGEIDRGEDDEQAGILDIPVHAFDVVIADECHRGYTSQELSKWREVLDHFDAIKIGLTATPAAHTASYFKELAYSYAYEKAVEEEYLVDYDAVAIHSDITIKGMDLAEGQTVTKVDGVTGFKNSEVLEDNIHVDTTQIEREATSPDRNLKIIREFKKYALAQEKEFGRFPKTLVFAMNDLPHTSHADALVDIINREFARGEGFCKKITGNSDRPLELIRKFRNRQEPSVAVTVDMLSTGVDVPKIENIILLRPIRSRILFVQMLGRGTRLCNDVSPPKNHFTVFDVYGLLDVFKDKVDIAVEPPDKPTRTISEIVREIENNVNRGYNVRVLTKRLLRVAKSISADGRKQFASIIGTEDISEFARGLKPRLDSDWEKTVSLLKRPDFSEMMANYPRERVFIIGEEALDNVTSELIFKAPNGKLLKPVDYIKMFEKFVKENPEHIEALELLLKRPRDFDTNALHTLRRKLEERPEKFTEERLRKAYNKELADILSLVKHAVRGIDIEDPTERAQKAVASYKEGKTFTPEQEAWLGMIEQTLASRIILEPKDFDTFPFSRKGGILKARVVFEGHLDEVIADINEKVLA